MAFDREMDDAFNGNVLTIGSGNQKIANTDAATVVVQKMKEGFIQPAETLNTLPATVDPLWSKWKKDKNTQPSFMQRTWSKMVPKMRRHSDLTAAIAYGIGYYLETKAERNNVQVITNVASKLNVDPTQPERQAVKRALEGGYGFSRRPRLDLTTATTIPTVSA